MPQQDGRGGYQGVPGNGNSGDRSAQKPANPRGRGERGGRGRNKVGGKKSEDGQAQAPSPSASAAGAPSGAASRAAPQIERKADEPRPPPNLETADFDDAFDYGDDDDDDDDIG